MKTRMFIKYSNGLPIYKWINLQKWPFIMPCRCAWPDIRDTYHCYVWRNGRCHKGADFIGYSGQPIYSVGAGTVIKTGIDYWYGNYIDILYGNNNGYRIVARYAHLKMIAVIAGEKVSKGQFIASMGRTGDSDCDHLHFEMRLAGFDENTKLPLSFDDAIPVDPIPFLPEKEVAKRVKPNSEQNQRLANDTGL